MPDYLTVSVPVENLRKEPVDMEFRYIHDELQETQVLYNERLLLKRKKGNWIFVEALEQKTYRKNRWQGYPGWIKAESVMPLKYTNSDVLVIKTKISPVFYEPSSNSPIIVQLLLGTKLSIAERDEREKFIKVVLANNIHGWIKSDDVFLGDEKRDAKKLRKEVVKTARLFIGMPYLWGGRSICIQNANIITGVDCSGLVNLSYRVINIDLPRNAHDQWLISESITPYDLDLGDLIFISEENKSEKIVHVMLYAGDGKVIEAYETKSAVREISFFERFGIEIPEIKSTVVEIKNRYVYFKRVRLNGYKKDTN